MKKLYTEGKYKSFSRWKKLKEKKRNEYRKAYLKHGRRNYLGLSRQQQWEKKARAKYETITAPQDFSFIKNPEGIIEFLSKIRATAKRGRNVFIDLNDIRSFTPDTMALLLSKIADRHFMSGMKPKSNAPSNSHLAAIFAQSGFYDYVNSMRTPKSKGFALLHTKENKMVQAEQALELIFFATEKLYGKPRFHTSVQRVLLECMMNTHGHASRNPSRHETWWAMAYSDPEEKRASFTFVDNGIGIFESIEIIGFKKNFELFVLNKDNRDILKDILNGEFGSRTGDPRRGKGLPAIYSAFRAGKIRNLVVVANDVYGNIGNDEYRILKSPFKGTFLHWEISNE